MLAIIGFINVSDDSLALVRVFVPTYRRHVPLCRAIESLRVQTFERWVCEIHNDDPIDDFPATLVERLNDPRISLRQHRRNLGPSETFNLFYRGTREPYYSILEDDNWWEPEFLNTMYREMQSHPNIVLAWCNQKIWEEYADGSWRDTGRFANPPEPKVSRLVSFGDWRQIMGAAHANGAMLLRSQPHQIYLTPPGWPFAFVEAIRERMMPHPLLYISQPLAVYSLTLQTARTRSRAEWVVTQSLLAATFIRRLDPSILRIVDLVADAQTKSAPATNPLIFSAIIEPSCRPILRFAKASDWLLFLRSIIRRPQILWHVLLSRHRHHDWWDLLDHHTAQRFEERRLQDRQPDSTLSPRADRVEGCVRLVTAAPSASTLRCSGSSNSRSACAAGDA
jgi:Glycosyl transferase family 2